MTFSKFKKCTVFQKNMTVLFCMSWKSETKTNEVSGIIADITEFSLADIAMSHADFSLTAECIQGSTDLEPFEAYSECLANTWGALRNNCAAGPVLSTLILSSLKPRTLNKCVTSGWLFPDLKSTINTEWFHKPSILLFLLSLCNRNEIRTKQEVSIS